MAPPLGIYVHVPFCAVRCGYCDFNTYVSTQGRDGFAGAIAQELEQARAQLGGRAADTVFIGGGTPSLLDPAELRTILDAKVNLSKDVSDVNTQLNATIQSLNSKLHG